MFKNHVYGIDLGSNMIKIYSQNSNEILKEKNMIAIRNKDTVLAVGDEAYEIYEKNPTNVKVSSPMLNGMIANISHLEIMLQLLLDKTGRSVGRHPVIYFAVPVDMTEIEKRAYYSIAHTGQLRQSKVLLVERPIADALALGIPIMRTKGSMIVNIGAATTEISVIADTRVIISKVIPVGGDRLTQDILTTIRRKLNFSISERTAGRLKVSLANLEKDTKDARKIIGIDCVSGLPRERVITSPAVNEAITPAICEIITEIRAFLERIPPQIHKVILSEGIYLTGGSTHLPYIDRVLSRQIGCPILIVLSLSTSFSFAPVRNVLGYVIVPFQNGINEVGNWMTDQKNGFQSMKKLSAENEKLQKQVDELQAKNTTLSQDQEELDRLRTLYNLDTDYSEFEKVAAQVIGKDTGNWYSTFLINRGSSDGIAVDMNVIADGGLVGIVTETGAHWATVRSIIDDSSNVSATVTSISQNCMVTGDLQMMDDGKIRFIQLTDKEDQVQEGDKIVTSSVSNKFLKGILIGYISTLTMDSNNLTKSGTITPAVDFEHIEEVLVILNKKQTAES